MGSGAQHLTPVLLPEYWSNPSRYKSAVLSPRTAAQDTPLSNHISRISAPNLTTWSISSLSKFKYCLKADLYLNCSGSNPVPSSISLISKNKHSYTKDYSWNFSGTFQELFLFSKSTTSLSTKMCLLTHGPGKLYLIFSIIGPPKINLLINGPPKINLLICGPNNNEFASPSSIKNKIITHGPLKNGSKGTYQNHLTDHQKLFLAPMIHQKLIYPCGPQKKITDPWSTKSQVH